MVYLKTSGRGFFLIIETETQSSRESVYLNQNGDANYDQRWYILDAKRTSKGNLVFEKIPSA